MRYGPVTNYLEGTAEDIGDGTEIILQIASQKRSIKIVEVRLKHTAGSAATFSPFITRVDGIDAPTAISAIWVGTTGQAVAALSQATGLSYYGNTSDSGQLYLIPDPNTGSDNTFDWQVWWEAV